MDAADKVVVRTPITELWNEAGVVTARKLRHLSTPEIAAILRSGPVHFVVADVGKPIHWVPVELCFVFWKAELKSRVFEPDSSASLEDFPGEYAYSASLWETDGNQPVVVLEAFVRIRGVTLPRRGRPRDTTALRDGRLAVALRGYSSKSPKGGLPWPMN
jgi:hypothetical protein